ncbi:MAG: saccharopine dehydrogenase family protein [Nitriliruptoraceae bacterium]
MTHDRPYDLVLLGATGFTGRLVAEHLAGRVGTLRWAIAGRDRDRLQQVADALAATGTSVPDVEVVDVSDLVGLLDLAARTRALATTVGPYARLGEPVVQACVRAGTDYADITGEPAFVDLLRARYDADAARRGVRIVTCCGFDSVPHDLGVAFTVAQLPDDVPLTVRGYVRGQGRLSGGTLHSAVGAIADRTPPVTRPDRDPVVAPRRRAVALPARVHRVASLGGWGVPLPTIDPSIVLRSARELEGYGSAFRYGHYAHVRRLPIAAAGVATVGVAAAMASMRPTRAVLERLLPDAGTGPDEATRARSSFSVTFLGHGADASVRTRVAGGDPGYDETARMLGEAALLLAGGEAPGRAGVVTPAIALGWPYLERLREQGITFEVLAD